MLYLVIVVVLSLLIRYSKIEHMEWSSRALIWHISVSLTPIWSIISIFVILIITTMEFYHQFVTQSRIITIIKWTGSEVSRLSWIVKIKMMLWCHRPMRVWEKDKRRREEKRTERKWDGKKVWLKEERESVCVITYRSAASKFVFIISISCADCYGSPFVRCSNCADEKCWRSCAFHAQPSICPGQ